VTDPEPSTRKVMEVLALIVKRDAEERGEATVFV